MSFCQGFNFDTLLALISCIAGIVALFLGGTAFKNCIIKNKNDSTKNMNGGTDNSINFNGDYLSQGITEPTLLSVVNVMKEMTDVSFTSSMDKAYELFEKKCDENLRQIMDETMRIITDQKLRIAEYTKIDWIHIYFESAKNTSDIFMQQRWARVLAKELAIPDSFCYKTLDVLKNMSENEFKLFEFLCSISIDNGTVVKGEYLNNCGLNWICLQKLREYGLVSLDDSQQQISIAPNEQFLQIINNKFVLLFKNQTNEQLDLKFQCYMLTNAATELLSIASVKTDEQFAVKIASEIKHTVSNSCTVTLHKINYFYDNGKQLNYNVEDLCPKETNNDKNI